MPRDETPYERYQRESRCPIWICALLIVACSLVMFLLLWLTFEWTPAAGHEASSGMQYPQSCCGGTDCKPVPCEQIVEEGYGMWRYIPTGTIFDPWKVWPSQDRYCHVCMNNKDQNGLCIFIQQGS